MAAGFMDGEKEIIGMSSAGRGGVGGGRGRGDAAPGKKRLSAGLPGGRGGRGQMDLDLYKEMEGHGGVPNRGMGTMPGGISHGGAHHPADVAAFYGYPSHMDSMMSNGYLPSHRMPYGSMHAGYGPEMYAGAMEDMKVARMAHGIAPHLGADPRWSTGDPRMAGRGGMWQHHSARDSIRGMGPAGMYGRGDGMDPRMVEAHLYDDPSYSGHIGHSLHNPAHEMHMMHAMPGGPVGGPGGPSPGAQAQAQAGWGGGASGGMPRKVFAPFPPFGGSLTLFSCVCLLIVAMHNAGAYILFSAVGCRFSAVGSSRA